jgi:hypothetical protein
MKFTLCTSLEPESFPRLHRDRGVEGRPLRRSLSRPHGRAEVPAARRVADRFLRLAAHQPQSMPVGATEPVITEPKEGVDNRHNRLLSRTGARKELGSGVWSLEGGGGISFKVRDCERKGDR